MAIYHFVPFSLRWIAVDFGAASLLDKSEEMPKEAIVEQRSRFIVATGPDRALVYLVTAETSAGSELPTRNSA